MNEGIFVNISYKTRESCLGKLLSFLLCHIISHLKSYKCQNDETSAVGAALQIIVSPGMPLGTRFYPLPDVKLLPTRAQVLVRSS